MLTMMSTLQLLRMKFFGGQILRSLCIALKRRYVYWNNPILQLRIKGILLVIQKIYINLWIILKF